MSALPPKADILCVEQNDSQHDFSHRFPTERITKGWEMTDRMVSANKKRLNFRMKPNCTIQGRMDCNGLGNRRFVVTCREYRDQRASNGVTGFNRHEEKNWQGFFGHRYLPHLLFTGREDSPSLSIIGVLFHQVRMLSAIFDTLHTHVGDQERLPNRNCFPCAKHVTWTRRYAMTHDRKALNLIALPRIICGGPN